MLRPIITVHEVPHYTIFSLDAETVGLYGEPFAIAYTICNQDEKELQSGCLICSPENVKGEASNREWVNKNVIPHLPKEYNCSTSEELCEKIYMIWMDAKAKYQGMITIADFGYPVEATVFSRAIKSKEKLREFTGPYPLHEVETALLIAGIKQSEYPRVGNELPEHHPLSDARYSVRLFLTALKKTYSINSKL